MRRCKIEYACISCVGRLRRNNEDNFCCAGQIRADFNSTDEVELSGTAAPDTNELFAVFDGMGGEACGEIASYTAAAHAAEFVKDRMNYEEYLYELAERLNDKVREEADNRSLVIMGTTAAMLQVSGNIIYILNAGDSRIYKLSRHSLRQISEEHIIATGSGKAITKFLGMPEGHSLRPYIAMGKYKPGDMFLLCSDGITDMLTDEEIKDIIDDKRGADELARKLVDAALDKGGTDNITAILLIFTR